MRIVIVTDAWKPQVNGVVRTLSAVIAELTALGHEALVIAPDQFRSVACPTYREIRLALTTPNAIGRRIAALEPEAIHIATEGPLGFAARAWCMRRGTPFTTAYHTQFPDYLARRLRLPAALFWYYFKRFHAPAQSILVSTATVARQLNDHALHRTRHWTRGVDFTCFRPDLAPHPALAALPKPILLYVGRIAVEKNIEAFLQSDHDGSKIVVGDGPDRERLRQRYPRVAFLGTLAGAELASAYASADVLVFPSRTDTFGLVMIEALACGTPVAAFPVPGPLDVLWDDIGAMDECLDKAIAAALRCDRSACALYATTFSWAASARQFLAALSPLKERPAGAARGLRSPVGMHG